MRRGLRSGTRRRAFAGAAARGTENPMVRRTGSWIRSLNGNGAQMIVTDWKRSKRAAGLVRGDPHRLVALPTAAKDVFGKTRQQVCRESRLLQGKRVIGTWNDHQ